MTAIARAVLVVVEFQYGIIFDYVRNVIFLEFPAFRIKRADSKIFAQIDSDIVIAVKSIDGKIAKVQRDIDEMTTAFIEAKNALLRANIEKRMNDYEKLIEDLKSQKEQLERERGNQFTENDILEFVADLLQGDPADKDYQKKLIDNLVVKVFVGDGYITAHIKLGNATEVADIRLEEVKKALEHIFNSVQTLSLLAQRKGFEPLVLLWEHTRFRVVRVRPLRHLCITFSYYTILICFCQSFRQVFYQKSRQNSDYDTREHAERADERELYIKRFCLHQQDSDGSPCDVAENSPRYAHGHEADLREYRRIQRRHDRISAKAACQIEGQDERRYRQRGYRVFQQHENERIARAEYRYDEQHHTVRKPYFYIRRHGQQRRDERFYDKHDARQGEKHAERGDAFCRSFHTSLPSPPPVIFIVRPCGMQISSPLSACPFSTQVRSGQSASATHTFPPSTRIRLPFSKFS